MAWRMVIIDDEEVFRLGLRSLVAAELRAEMSIVGEATTARAGFPIVDREQPDLVTLDVALPGMDGVSAARELLRRSPGTKVLVITAQEAVDDVLGAFACGVQGYALKSEPAADLAVALRRVAQGRRYVAPPFVQLVERHPTDGNPSVLRVLSEREREVFRLACSAVSNAEIARELCISKKTVETHLHRIHKKFGVQNGAELIYFAAVNGLLRAGRRILSDDLPDSDNATIVELDQPATMLKA